MKYLDSRAFPNKPSTGEYRKNHEDVFGKEWKTKGKRCKIIEVINNKAKIQYIMSGGFDNVLLSDLIENI